MLAISALAIFELVRRKIPDVTPDEINYTIMQGLPYMEDDGIEIALSRAWPRVRKSNG